METILLHFASGHWSIMKHERVMENDNAFDLITLSLWVLDEVLRFGEIDAAWAAPEPRRIPLYGITRKLEMINCM